MDSCERLKAAEAIILAMLKRFDLDRPNAVHDAECSASPLNRSGPCDCFQGAVQSYARKYLTPDSFPPPRR